MSAVNGVGANWPCIRGGGARLVESRKDTALDLARCVVEFVFGDVFSWPALDLKSREIATIAARQLRVHINAALNVGCGRTEIAENMIQMAAYAGFPEALDGITAPGEVFAARDGWEST